MDCFVGVEFAVLYGVLCLVAANVDSGPILFCGAALFYRSEEQTRT